MKLIQTIQTTTEPETYVINGCLASGGAAVALSLSNNLIRLYDARSTAFIHQLSDHTDIITDLVSSPAQPQLLFSSQEDGGVMVTDLRQGKPAHFITDACGTGIACCSLSLSPSGSSLVVAKTGDLDIYDSRTWTPVRRVEQMHWDEITRVRHLDEHVICSAGEDLMINYIDTAATTLEDDILLQATHCGEVITRMSCMHELERVAMVGSCENAYVYPYAPEAPESKIHRPDYSTYLVDWCMVGGELVLVSGVKDDDGNAGPLTVVTFGPAASMPTDDAGEARQSSNGGSTSSSGCVQQKEAIPLTMVHRQLTRVALGFGDRLITGGEDGLLAFWSVNSGPNTTPLHSGSTVSSSIRGGEKTKGNVSVFQPPSTNESQHHAQQPYQPQHQGGGGAGGRGYHHHPARGHQSGPPRPRGGKPYR